MMLFHRQLYFLFPELMEMMCRTKTMSNRIIGTEDYRIGDIIFRFFHRIVKRKTVSQERCDSRRQGTTRPMSVFRHNLFRQKFDRLICFGIIEDIRQNISIKMSGF